MRLEPRVPKDSLRKLPSVRWIRGWFSLCWSSRS